MGDDAAVYEQIRVSLTHGFALSRRDAAVVVRLRRDLTTLSDQYGWPVLWTAAWKLEKGELKNADDVLDEAETRAPNPQVERAVGRIRDRLARVRVRST